MYEILKKGVRLLFLMGLIFTIPAITRHFMTTDTMNWYHSLKMSSLTPPSIYFSLVWTVLYVCMAISAFLAWDKASPRYFVFQLAFNGMWPFVFFYLKEPVVALFILVLLLVCLLKAIMTFYKASKMAGILLMPVFAWCCFAFYLNAYIVICN